MTKADILFAGSGLAGLTLALECVRRPFFKDKKILLIDRDEKSRNDRTWCFWAKDTEEIPAVLHKTWNKCLFYGEGFEKTLDIAPYRYCMVRGIDFYQEAAKELALHPNVQRITADILDMDAQQGILKTTAGDFQGDWLFNSAWYPASSRDITGKFVDGSQTTTQVANAVHSPQHTFLLQHFKGWVIETPEPVFDPEAMTFMDYRLEQHGETRFVYVLPLSETRALVEFTVFSAALCTAQTYDAELGRYCSEVLRLRDYRVAETEFGVIPMTDLPLVPQAEGRVINIGTAGGFVKASSGYAFLRTQRKLRAFAAAWAHSGSPDAAMLQSSRTFRALDSIMLRVLKEGSVSGKTFFSLLFRKLPAPLVFRFLDEDANLFETLRVLSAPPTWPFFMTAMRRMF